METGVNFNMSHAVSIPASKCNAENTSDDLSMLPADFEPGETDVICQRGKQFSEWFHFRPNRLLYLILFCDPLKVKTALNTQETRYLESLSKNILPHTWKLFHVMRSRPL